jgi:hypothetical protein
VLNYIIAHFSALWLNTDSGIHNWRIPWGNKNYPETHIGTTCNILMKNTRIRNYVLTKHYLFLKNHIFFSKCALLGSHIPGSESAAMCILQYVIFNRMPVEMLPNTIKFHLLCWTTCFDIFNYVHVIENIQQTTHLDI